VLCALCSVLCALCSVLCALCSVLCALCSNPKEAQPLPRQVEVEFLTGPNLVEYQYTVGCYNATDTVDCGDILSGGAESIDSVSGLLPRKYSRVLANLTVRDRYALLCVLFIGTR
jgi:hypothetical protein